MGLPISFDDRTRITSVLKTIAVSRYGILRGVRIQFDDHNIGPDGSRPQWARIGSLRRP